MAFGGINGMKWRFRTAPLLSLAQFLAGLGLVVTALAAIISVALSWGRVSTMSTSFTGAMAGAFTSSAVFTVCIMVEIAAFIVAAVYYFQNKKSADYIPVKPAIVLSLVALAVTVVGAPLLLSVVENILLIIGIIVICVIGFFVLSGALGGGGEGFSSSAAASAGNAKDAPKAKEFEGKTFKVAPQRLAVYNMSKYKHFDLCEGDWYVEVGGGLHGKDNVRPLCTVNEYRKGKCRFVNPYNGKEIRP